jgi:hypothetical protein
VGTKARFFFSKQFIFIITHLTTSEKEKECQQNHCCFESTICINMSSAKNSIDNPNMTMDIDSMINECDSESSRPFPPGVSLKKKELPDKKTMVLMFAKQLEDREKHVSGAKGTVIKLHHCISCPMNDECKGVKNKYDSPNYLWQKGSGYSNPFKHILACVFKGDLEEMCKAYWIMVDQQRGKLPRNGIKSWFDFH